MQLLIFNKTISSSGIIPDKNKAVFKLYGISLSEVKTYKGLDGSMEWYYTTDDTNTFETGNDTASLVKIPYVYTELRVN